MPNEFRGGRAVGTYAVGGLTKSPATAVKQPDSPSNAEAIRSSGVLDGGTNARRRREGRPSQDAYSRRGRPMHCFSTPTVREIRRPAPFFDDTTW